MGDREGFMIKSKGVCVSLIVESIDLKEKHYSSITINGIKV